MKKQNNITLTPTQLGIVTLVRSGIKGVKEELPQDFDWKEAKDIIASQELYGIVLEGLKISKLPVPEWLKTSFCSRVSYLTNLWRNAEKIIKAFSDNDVEYIPLKGISIKNVYPNRFMRYMGDVDILIREADYESKIKCIMEKNGFHFTTMTEHDYGWQKGSSHFELHTSIIPSYNSDYYKVIGDGWEWLQKYGNETYIFIHLCKHYRNGGIGISHLVDIELIKDKISYEAIEELGLEQFYANVLDTLDSWFGNKPFNNVGLHITHYLFDSGAFANTVNAKQSVALQKNKSFDGSVFGKVFYFYRLLFPRKTEMIETCPALKQYPVLLPWYYLKRLLYAVFKKSSWKAISNYYRASDRANEFEQELAYVGLDFKEIEKDIW